MTTRSPSFQTCTFCSEPFARKSELFTFKHLKNVCFAGETWHFRFLFLTPVRQGLNSSPPGTCDIKCLRFTQGVIEASNWPAHDIATVAFIYQQNNKLNNSHLADFFTSLHSFPCPCFQSSYYVTVSISVSLFCKSDKDVDYRHDKPNKPKTNK